MTDSQRHQTTSSGRRKNGQFRLGSRPANKCDFIPPEEVGKQYGRVVILAAKIHRIKGQRQVQVRCVDCGSEHNVHYYSLTHGRSRGCVSCANKRQIPFWLDRRIAMQKQRCTNPKNAGYLSYGGRGIEFRFASVLEAGLWVKENLGLHKHLELDRINNDGHYEPGNLRWVTGKANRQNTQKVKHLARLAAFRKKYPEVRYADNTLRNLVRTLTDEEIVDRWYNLPSCKPKGVYGTFSTLAPADVSPPEEN